ncbi:hypothetical protein [Nocardia sp. MDA0666]|uniref:hypothetical protein n=1 Tax=Nocardia sp. MDA0666 TaxID=2135448 RepID=UPI0011B2853E|nr:hypothetical protein [Nocardia sp. MDA0666]
MSVKIELLRRRGAVDELERRWEEDDDFSGNYNDSRLSLPLGVELAEHLPAGLRALYALADHPQFGDLEFNAHQFFGPQRLIDSTGEVIDAGHTLTIGQAQEQSIVLDLDTETVFIFDFLYFRHGLDSGFVLRCDSVAEFISTVALGPRYSDIHGPHETWGEAWWLADPGYLYLQELAFA